MMQYLIEKVSKTSRAHSHFTGFYVSWVKSVRKMSKSDSAPRRLVPSGKNHSLAVSSTLESVVPTSNDTCRVPPPERVFACLYFSFLKSRSIHPASTQQVAFWAFLFPRWLFDLVWCGFPPPWLYIRCESVSIKSFFLLFSSLDSSLILFLARILLAKAVATIRSPYFGR